MTWYCKGKEVPFDRDEDFAHECLWDFIVTEYNSIEEALRQLMLDPNVNGVRWAAILLAGVQESPNLYDGEYIQEEVDNFIWENVNLPFDDEMRDNGQKTYTLAGLTFKWVDPYKEDRPKHRILSRRKR